MLTWLLDPHAWAALAALTAMEIVLGIDNVVFISILVSRPPAEEAKRARQIGLALAFAFRIVLLFLLTWLIGLTAPVLKYGEWDLSWRDIVLIAGGLFLIIKATREVHAEIEGEHEAPKAIAARNAYYLVLGQVVVIDIVFSVDSIITAIGMAQQIEIMVLAVLIAVGVMYVASGTVSRFIAHNPPT